jgi:hypothetical protein
MLRTFLVLAALVLPVQALAEVQPFPAGFRIE